jgi:PAS domain S-box-containing protein
VSDPKRPDVEQGIASDAVEAMIRLARADFSVRLKRSFSKDDQDVLAMFINLIAEELERLTRERELQQLELERAVQRLAEAFASLAAGNFRIRAPRTGKGDPIDVLSFLLNNTAVELGNAFTEIERQRAVVEAVLDSMVDGVLLLSGDGKVLRANRAMERLLGWEHPPALAGASFHSLLASRDRDVATTIRQAAGTAPRDREVLFVGKSGAVVPLSINVSTVQSADGALHGTVVVARDERELKKARAHLQLEGRLATMGMLAAGVAHEVNNPLAFVSSNIDYVVDELAKSGGGALTPERHAEVMKALRASQAGAERVRLIVRDLHAFARVEEDAVTRLDPTRLVDSALNMLRSEIRNRARVERAYAAVPAVDANEARLVQVFLNLVQNAAQAITPGAASANTIRVVTGTSRDGEAIVEVCDTGEGIASDNLPRIFDAFFTTKPLGVGTGLGLAICQKIVISFGGRIEVDTEVGKGSTFRVVLPASRQMEAAAPASVPAPRRAKGPRRRVLVVDDEAEIGESLRRLLGAAHDVVSATRGADALALLSRGSFDVILCDLMMPEMTGMDVYRRIEVERPEVAERVVFMTGANVGAGLSEFLASVRNPCIAKPFDRARVLSVVEATR